MVESFLARLTKRSSIPIDSMLLAYISIAQGGLGLMDAYTRAVPDMVLSMSQSIRYADHGFSFTKKEPPFRLHPTHSALFSTITNPSSHFLRTFYQVLGDVALAGTHVDCADPVEFFLSKGSFNSARDRLKQSASRRRSQTLHTIARPSLKAQLPEILIPSTSWPIIGMHRSDKRNRRPDDLFLINLKTKLHLEQYHPDNRPLCICGALIDSFGMHTFCCRRVSKLRMHNSINTDFAPRLAHLLVTAGILAKGGVVDTETPNLVPSLPNCRPLDSSWRPTRTLKNTHLAPPYFGRAGLDYTITPPVGYLPPSQYSAAKSNYSALAAKHLSEAERKKLMRNGKSDPYNNSSLSGEGIIGEMLAEKVGLCPAAVSPLGYRGAMFQRFFYGSPVNYKFPPQRPNAKRMYTKVMSASMPVGIVPLATAAWKRNKPKKQLFFGHSYTCPTPHEYAEQQFGLAFSNAAAIHIRDARLGQLTSPLPTEDEDVMDHSTVPTPDITVPYDDTEDQADMSFDLFADIPTDMMADERVFGTQHLRARPTTGSEPTLLPHVNQIRIHAELASLPTHDADTADILPEPPPRITTPTTQFAHLYPFDGLPIDTLD